MTISEFARERHIEQQAVNRYILRHNEIKELTHKEGKEVILSDEAIEILDKVYPLPRPIEVIEDTESIKKVAQLEATIIQLQQELLESRTKIAQAEATTILLEDRTKQLDEAKERIKSIEDRNTALQSENVRIGQEMTYKDKEISRLENERDQYKELFEEENRKSWWDKLMKR